MKGLDKRTEGNLAADLREIPKLSNKRAETHRFMRHIIGLFTETDASIYFFQGIETVLRINLRDGVIKGSKNTRYGNLVFELGQLTFQTEVTNGWQLSRGICRNR